MQNRPVIYYGGDRACYIPSRDEIHLPTRETFHSPEEFYSTAFHELSHATGHSSRLGRKGILEPTFFGSHEYSAEELCAEFCSSMLCGVSGIEQQTIENQSAYIAGWLRKLRSDKRIAVTAASKAQKSADYILNRNTQEHESN